MFDKLKSRSKGATKSNRTTHRGFSITNILHAFYRFVQIVMACVVIGYYASDLNKANKEKKYSDSKWVYAVVVGSLAAVTALILAILGIVSSFRVVSFFFPWEWILVILWAALAGIFGGMYRTENPEMDSGVQKMKTAFYFDCANLAFWGLSAIVATIMFFMGRRGGKSVYSGRAKT